MAAPLFLNVLIHALPRFLLPLAGRLFKPLRQGFEPFLLSHKIKTITFQFLQENRRIIVSLMHPTVLVLCLSCPSKGIPRR